MASSSADWVLGEARLISSPSTTLAKMPPGRNSKVPLPRFHTVTPVTSEGNRSGVNWMRRQVQSMLAASALARLVLPTPGTSSMRRWPSATRQTRPRRMASSLPWMTSPTFSTTASKRSANESIVRGPTRCLAIGGASLLSASVRLALAVDVGGTKMAAGLVTDEGNVVTSAVSPTPAGDDPEALFSVVLALVDSVGGDGE